MERSHLQFDPVPVPVSVPVPVPVPPDPRTNPGARGFTLTNRVEYKPSLSIGRGTRPHPRCHGCAITVAIHHEVLCTS
jgi:hypothetical protein